MSKADDGLWLLRQPSLEVDEFTLSVWDKDRFVDVDKFSSNTKDEPFSLLSANGNLLAFSSKTVRIFSRDSHSWKSLPLKGKLRGGLQESSAAAKKGDSIYLGFNTGEWGGGLQRIDLHTGQVKDVERRDTKELCAGPLNKDCDPVTAVAADPQNPDCVFAAVGLVHMMSHGNILRVCKEKVSVFFEKTERVQGFGDKEIDMTQPFFGLAAMADGSLWAISPASLFRIGADGIQKEQHDLPKPSAISGIHMSRELPGVIVLWTNANWAVAVSGYTPLLVPLEKDAGQEVQH